MKEEYGALIFATVVFIAILSSAFYVLSEEHKALHAAEKKCEDAGWTWFVSEEKCIMVKEVK